jgi:hypothetical protein
VTAEAVRVTDQLVRATAEALADGFHDDEIWAWLLPRPWQVRRVLPRYYEASIRHVFAPRAAAWTTTTAAGGTLWYPPGTAKLALGEQLRTGRALLPEGAARLPGDPAPRQHSVLPALRLRGDRRDRTA